MKFNLWLPQSLPFKLSHVNEAAFNVCWDLVSSLIHYKTSSDSVEGRESN